MASSSSALSRNPTPVAITYKVNATIAGESLFGYSLTIDDYRITQFRSLAQIVPFNEVGESQFFAILSLTDRGGYFNSN